VEFIREKLWVPRSGVCGWKTQRFLLVGMCTCELRVPGWFNFNSDIA